MCKGNLTSGAGVAFDMPQEKGSCRTDAKVPVMKTAGSSLYQISQSGDLHCRAQERSTQWLPSWAGFVGVYAVCGGVVRLRAPVCVCVCVAEPC